MFRFTRSDCAFFALGVHSHALAFCNEMDDEDPLDRQYLHFALSRLRSTHTAIPSRYRDINFEAFQNILDDWVEDVFLPTRDYEFGNVLRLIPAISARVESLRELRAHRKYYRAIDWMELGEQMSRGEWMSHKRPENYPRTFESEPGYWDYHNVDRVRELFELLEVGERFFSLPDPRSPTVLSACAEAMSVNAKAPAEIELVIRRGSIRRLQPRWIADQRRLYYGPTLLRAYRTDAPTQFEVLNALQAIKWRGSVRVPALKESGRRRVVVNDINRGLNPKLIKFVNQGDGTIGWTEVS